MRGSEGHPAADDDLASEKGHLLAKRALFPRLPGGAAPPPARYGPAYSGSLMDVCTIPHRTAKPSYYRARQAWQTAINFSI